MKFSIKNLGPLKTAEMELGDLTIICGENNTGKTYLSYSLYGFFRYLKHLLGPRGNSSFPVSLSESDVENLMDGKKVLFDFSEKIKYSQAIFQDVCNEYTKTLYSAFSAPDTAFADSCFQCEIDIGGLPQRIKDYSGQYSNAFFVSSPERFYLEKKIGDFFLTIQLKMKYREKDYVTEFDKEKCKGTPVEIKTMLEDEIRHYLREIFFEKISPQSFFVSTERTGISIFGNTIGQILWHALKISREVKKHEQNTEEILAAISKLLSDYPEPINKNLEFHRELSTIVKQSSQIVKDEPMIIEEFQKVLGGKYSVSTETGMHFHPDGTNVSLTMNESSSSVPHLFTGFCAGGQSRDCDKIEEYMENRMI